MGLGKLAGYLKGHLGSLGPPHAFVLTRERLVHVSLPDGTRNPRETLGAAKLQAVRLLPGALREGPGRVPVGGAPLSDALASLLRAGAKAPTAASLAVPDDFVRMVAIDLEPGSEKNPHEVEEVLQWKLGRAFGEDAPPLRISWLPAGAAPGGGTRVLGIGVPEEAATSWEAAFAGRGIRIGVLVPATLAVASLARTSFRGGDGFLVWADGGTVSVTFYSRGALRFLRSKAEGDPDEAVQGVRLTASFVEGGAGGTGQGLDVAGPAVVGPESSPVVARFRAFRKESGGPEPTRLSDLLGRSGVPAGPEDPDLIVGTGLLVGEE